MSDSIENSISHLDSAKQLIQETRYLLNLTAKIRKGGVDYLPEQENLSEAETIISRIGEALTAKRKSDTPKVDLSDAISKARVKVEEHNRVKEHNNNMRLRLVNFAQEIKQDLTGILHENNFSDFRIEITTNEERFFVRHYIQVYKQGHPSHYAFMAVGCDIDHYHKLPLIGEQASYFKEIEMYASGTCKQKSLAEFVDDNPEHIEKFVRWLMS